MDLSHSVQARHDDVRQRLIEESISLFVRRGYAATTVREIVEAAGVSKPVLYYYFKSKEGLYLEIMNGIGLLFDQQLEELRSTAGTVRSRLLNLFTGMFDAAHENLAVVRLAYAIYFGPPQGAPFIDFNRFFDQTIATVDDLINNGIKNGEITPCDRSALNWTLVGSYQTILEEQICRLEPRINRDGLIAVISQILDGVSPHDLKNRQQGALS
jgi:AcrR family transcriptional regulator